MANIVVFGKPRAFESYEYNFGGEILSVENTHSEPIVKPVQYQEPILHYYWRVGYAGIEYYTRAKGFESERVGIVFGVSLKSSTDFNIFNTIALILQPFWIDFASALLSTSNQFVDDSITNRLKNTQWSNEEVESIQRTSLSSPIPKPEHGVLLLVAENIEDIKSVENLLKGYEDVYISSSPDVFKESCNEVIYKEAGNQICKIEGEQIVPWPEEDIVSQPAGDDTKSVFKYIARLPWGGKRQDNNQGTISGDSSSADDTTNTQRKGWVAACASILIVVLIVCVGMYIWRNIGSSVDDPIAGDDKSSPTQEYKEDPDDLNGISVQFYEHPTAINEALNLRPKILPETCTRYYPSDITFQVSDPSVADVKYQNDQYVLFVKKRSKTDVQIKVRAFIHDKLLGEQTYTIAKKQEPSKPIADPNKFVVPTYQGRPRTIKEYIGNLRNDVNKNPKLKDKTIQICQQIINSSNYPNNADAIVLRDSLNNVADAGF